MNRRKVLSSFVLRVTEKPTLEYELHDLRTGESHAFGSVAALQRFLRGVGERLGRTPSPLTNHRKP